MDSIRASEAPDAGSIPAEATSPHKQKFLKKTQALPNAVLVRLSCLQALLFVLILFILLQKKSLVFILIKQQFNSLS